MPILRFALLAGLLLLVSCKSDNGDGNPLDSATPFPYATPTEASMQLDLQDLQQKSARAVPDTCHLISALAVTWANLNVVVRLAVPVAALGACVSQHPVYLGERTWRWTANGGVGANAWTAELTGHDAGEGVVEWAMRVTGTLLALDRFLWYDGRCDVTASVGEWHFYDAEQPQTPSEILQCGWSLPPSLELPRSVGFEVVAEGLPTSGDRLLYALADSIASVAYEAADPPQTVSVEWDLRDGAGSATNAAGMTCCWGPRPDFPDIPCGK